MRLLVELRLFEAVVGVAIIGAGILAVGVEEQFVEPAGEIVGMLGVAARARLPVDLIELARGEVDRLADQPVRLEELRPLERRVALDEQDEIADVAFFDDKPPVHIGLARADCRIARDVHRRAAIGETHLDRGFAGQCAAIAIFAPVMIYQDKLAHGDELSKHFVQEPHARDDSGRRAVSPPRLTVCYGRRR